MEITEVRVFPVDEEKLKAYVTITFDHCFVVRDLKVIHGTTGLFIAMPAKRRKDGTFKDIAHPLNNQMRQYLEEKVLSVYKQQVAQGGAAPAGGAAQPSAPAPETPAAEPEPGTAPASGGEAASGEAASKEGSEG